MLTTIPLIFGMRGPQLIFILVVILLIFGASRLPKIMRNMGRGVHQFKQGLEDAKEEMNKPIRRADDRYRDDRDRRADDRYRDDRDRRADDRYHDERDRRDDDRRDDDRYRDDRDRRDDDRYRDDRDRRDGYRDRYTDKD